MTWSMTNDDWTKLADRFNGNIEKKILKNDRGILCCSLFSAHQVAIFLGGTVIKRITIPRTNIFTQNVITQIKSKLFFYTFLFNNNGYTNWRLWSLKQCYRQSFKRHGSTRNETRDARLNTADKIIEENTHAQRRTYNN